jgi:hypothetical protein
MGVDEQETAEVGGARMIAAAQMLGREAMGSYQLELGEN